MKLVSTALLAAALGALGACGDGEENVAAVNAGDELYEVAPDETATDNLLGNEGLGNDSGPGNAADGAGDNQASENAAGNAQ